MNINFELYNNYLELIMYMIIMCISKITYQIACYLMLNSSEVCVHNLGNRQIL